MIVRGLSAKLALLMRKTTFFDGRQAQSKEKTMAKMVAGGLTEKAVAETVSHITHSFFEYVLAGTPSLAVYLL